MLKELNRGEHGAERWDEQQQDGSGCPRVGSLQVMVQGGAQEGVPLKTLGGGLGRLDGKPQAGAREVGWEPGRVVGDPRRAAHWRHRGASADAPRAPTPARQRLTLGGMGVRLNGQAIWGASKSFWISGQSVWVLQL